MQDLGCGRSERVQSEEKLTRQSLKVGPFSSIKRAHPPLYWYFNHLLFARYSLVLSVSLSCLWSAVDSVIQCGQHIFPTLLSYSESTGLFYLE